MDTNMASTSTSTTHNVCVDETSVNAKKEHINVDKYWPPYSCQKSYWRISRSKNYKRKWERKKTLQDVGEQKDAREKLHTLKRIHNNTKPSTPKRTQEIRHNANINCTIVSHNINHNTNIAASSTSNIQNIQLDQTSINAERKDPLSSNEEDLEAQVQTPPKKENNTNTDRQVEQRTEQMH